MLNVLSMTQRRIDNSIGYSSKNNETRPLTSTYLRFRDAGKQRRKGGQDREGRTKLPSLPADAQGERRQHRRAPKEGEAPLTQTFPVGNLTQTFNRFAFGSTAVTRIVSRTRVAACKRCKVEASSPGGVLVGRDMYIGGVASKATRRHALKSCLFCRRKCRCSAGRKKLSLCCTRSDGWKRR